jgi:predicted dehydrogenase
MEEQDRTFTRRDFLKASLAAAAFSAGLSLASEEKATGAIPDGTETVCGIIGSGAQGQNLMSQALRIPGVRFAAVCDIYPPNLEKGLGLAGQAAASYTDYRKMLERKDLQAVIVATPLHLHAPMSIDALDAGKHVFCEKTMARTIDQCKEMVRAVRRTRGILQVGHQRRYNPLYQHALDLIKQGAIGRITHIRAAWHRNGSWRRAVPDPKYERLLNWRLYRKSSAGLMTELGSHAFDVINWFLGEVPSSVAAMGGIDYWKDGREVEDNVEVIFEYPGGVKVIYSSITSNAHDGAYEQIMGDQGALVMTEYSGLLFREEKAEALPWAVLAHKQTERGKEAIVLDSTATKKREQKPGEAIGAAEATKDAYTLELEAFFHSVHTRRKPLCDVEAGFRSAVTALRANEAIRSSRKLSFPADLFEA